MLPLAVTFHVSPMYSAASGGHKVLRHAPASGIKRTFDKGGVGIHFSNKAFRAEGLFQKILPYKPNRLQTLPLPRRRQVSQLIPRLNVDSLDSVRLYPLSRVLPP